MRGLYKRALAKRAALKPEVALLPHQQRVLTTWQQENPPGMLVYHGLGSGKTPTSIAVAESMPGDKNVLVPASLRENYRKQLDRFSTNVTPYNIVSYPEALKGKVKEAPLSIYDEAHRMGRSGTEISRLVDKIPGRKMLLTGTPVRNEPAEIVPILKAIAPDRPIPRTAEEFKRRFIRTKTVWPTFLGKLFMNVKPGETDEFTNVEAFKKLIKGRVDYQRSKGEFPVVMENHIGVTMTPEQSKLYRGIMGKSDLAWKVRLNLPPTRSEAAKLNSFLSGTRQVSNNPAAFDKRMEGDPVDHSPKLQRMIQDIQDQEKEVPNFKALVYSNYLDAGIVPMANRLRKMGIPHSIFTGEMDDKLRRKVIDEYNNGQIKVLLVSGAGSEGLDLKGTKMVQVMEPHWNLARTKQVIGRAVRHQSHSHLPPAERNVNVRWYYAKPKQSFLANLGILPGDPGVDKYMQSRAMEKQRVINQMLQAMREMGTPKPKTAAADPLGKALISYLQNVTGLSRMHKVVGKYRSGAQALKETMEALESGEGEETKSATASTDQIQSALESLSRGPNVGMFNAMNKYHLKNVWEQAGHRMSSHIKDLDKYQRFWGRYRKVIDRALEKMGSDVSLQGLPYRERVEMLPMRNGKVLGVKFPGGVFVFPGGGVDQGENPAAAASREVLEESGYPISNARPAGVPPVIHEWTPENIANDPKMQERAKKFRGSSTQFFLGDVGRRQKFTGDPDAYAGTEKRKLMWVTPEQALDWMAKNPKLDPSAALSGKYRESDVRRVDILKKLIREKQLRLKTAAEVAVGLPDPHKFGDPRQILKNKILEWVVQEHRAKRSGRHYDVRFGLPGPNPTLYSWATKKELPKPGDKPIMLYQQPLHTGSYADFKGEIPHGYGAGTVDLHDRGKVVVSEATPHKIKFMTIHKGDPEYFTLIRRSGKPTDPQSAREAKTQGGSWLMINTTPLHIDKMLGGNPENFNFGKLKYTSVPAEKVDKVFDPAYVTQPKIDGASMLYHIMHDKIEAISYRQNKLGRPIVHTQRIFGPGGSRPIKALPKELEGTVLRGEVYGMRNNSAIPPQELGGILNASVANSIEKQRAKQVNMKNMIFSIVRRGKENVPPGERLKAMTELMQYLPPNRFHLPETAQTPEESKALWQRIVEKKHPLTTEGIVGWPKADGRPVKVKVMPESDVWVKGTFPGEGKYKDTHAGGIEYALSPEGPAVGRIGTGFTDDDRRDMIQNPANWVGRMARIRSQGAFPSGAHRAPAFIARHEDYPLSGSDMEQVKGKIAQLKAEGGA